VHDASRLVYLTQTTLSTDDAGVIIDALKRAFPEIKEPPSSDICYATTNRQHAVRKVAPDCDVVLVVGSRNSSNSVRLTEIARNVGTPGHLLDDVSELDPAWFPTGRERVMVTAGASAPEDLVAGLCRTLVERYGATLEQRELVEEDMEFNLPGALRREMIDRARPDAAACTDHDAGDHGGPVRRGPADGRGQVAAVSAKTQVEKKNAPAVRPGRCRVYETDGSVR
jgi:4-hydroxy-3-methylbut-2-enyl diphosphate reductase